MKTHPACMEEVSPGEFKCKLGVLKSTVKTLEKRIYCSCKQARQIADAQDQERKGLVAGSIALEHDRKERMAADVRARIMAQVYRRYIVDPELRTPEEIEEILDERAKNGLTGYDGCGCSGLDEFVTRLLYRSREVKLK